MNNITNRGKVVVVFPDENGEVEIHCPHCSHFGRLDRVLVQQLNHHVSVSPCVTLVEFQHLATNEHRTVKNAHIPEQYFIPVPLLDEMIPGPGIFYVAIKRSHVAMIATNAIK